MHHGYGFPWMPQPGGDGTLSPAPTPGGGVSPGPSWPPSPGLQAPPQNGSHFAPPSPGYFDPPGPLMPDAHPPDEGGTAPNGNGNGTAPNGTLPNGNGTAPNGTLPSGNGQTWPAELGTALRENATKVAIATGLVLGTGVLIGYFIGKAR